MAETTFKLPGVPELLKSLRGSTCPACGGVKRPRMTLCYGCYKSLPHDAKMNLYKRVGDGYEPAVQFAMEFLGCTRFHTEARP